MYKYIYVYLETKQATNCVCICNKLESVLTLNHIVDQNVPHILTGAFSTVTSMESEVWCSSESVSVSSLPAILVVTIFLWTVQAKNLTNPSISFCTYLEILVLAFKWHGLIELGFYL